MGNYRGSYSYWRTFGRKSLLLQLLMWRIPINNFRTMTQPIVNQYQPNFVSPPGETLLETLEKRAIPVEELAAKLGISEVAIASLISGTTPITPEIALQLEQILGIPAHFWNNRERHYREYLARSQSQAIAD